MKSLLVTGGSGFIGRNLVERLRGAGYRVDAPGREALDLLDADAVAAFVERGAFDAVLHAATWNATRNSPKDVSRVLENNLRMFFNLTRCLDGYGKLIQFGSGAEYDRAHWSPRMREEDFGKHVPADDYGFSKYVMARAAEADPRVVDLRVFGCFGPHEDWEIRFVSNACCKAMHDLPITIRQDVAFDYLWIDDLVDVVRWFVEHDAPARAYNVCSGQTLTLRDLAGKVLAAAGKDLPVRVALDGMGREYSGDNRRLLATVDGLRFTPMDEAIGRLYRWYDARRDQHPRERLLADK